MADLPDAPEPENGILEEVVVKARRDLPANFNNLDNFKRQDFLKSSQFIFRILTKPRGLNTIESADLKEFSLFCESVEFPGKNLNATDIKIPGLNKIRVPFSKEYQEITTTFIHNHKIPAYEFFTDWHDIVTGTNNGTENYYFDELVTNFNIIQFTDMPQGKFRKLGGLSSILESIDSLNRNLFDSSKLFRITDIGQTFINRVNAVGSGSDKGVIFELEFRNAYPVSVASMASSWADDGFHKLSVTWAYERFIVNGYNKNETPS